MIRRRDLWPAGLLLAAFCGLLGPCLFTSRVYVYNDLTNLSLAWRTLVAEQVARGVLPLWNPYSAYGIPLIGNLQTGAFFPISVLFTLFPFTQALGPYLLALYCVAGCGAYLWLRRLGLSRSSCLAGAFAFSLSGFCVGHIQFPNILGAFVWMPFFFLFSESPLLLAVAAALSIHSGYPPITSGVAASCFILAWAWPRRATRAALAVSLFGGFALALALGAAVLLPGWEAGTQSARAFGMPRGERMEFSLAPRDAGMLLHPRLGAARVRAPLTAELAQQGYRRASYLPAWKSAYSGVLAAAAVLVGTAALARSAPTSAAGLAAFLSLSALLLFGDRSAPSAWIWDHLPGASLIRGPSRQSFLLAAATVPLAAMGVETIARARSAKRTMTAAIAFAGAVFIGGELLATGWRFYPTLPKDYYSSGGALVEFLRAGLDGGRYRSLASSGNVARWRHQWTDDEGKRHFDGAGFMKGGFDDSDAFWPRRLYNDAMMLEYRQRLFGTSNAPFHLPSATADYEPLIPARSARLNQLFATSQPEALAAMMRWADVRFVASRTPISAPGVVNRGKHVWHFVQAPKATSGAYWFPASWRERLGGDIDRMPSEAPAAPWRIERSREDHLAISGESKESGILYVAQPKYPGWKAYVNGRRVQIERALTAFEMISVPTGPWKVDLLYRPLSWKVGLLATLGALAALIVSGMKKTKALAEG
ncbi:MAG: YfhO family protein [Elusimicrobia bacterium]|nr:YfhO family protein [Elusimicrobiota bacterium]